MKHRSQPRLQSDDRTVVIGTRTEDDFWAEFNEQNTEKEPPRGSISAEDYAARFGISQPSAAMRLQRAAVRGELETGMFNRRIQIGTFMKMRQVRFYWPAHSVPGKPR